MGEVIPFRSNTTAPAEATDFGLPILSLCDSWRLALDQEGLSPGTIKSYLDTMRRLVLWLGQRDQCTCRDTDENPDEDAEQGSPAQHLCAAMTADAPPTSEVPDAESVATEHLRAFLVHRRLTTSPGNAAKEYRNLNVFWNWCVQEEERTPPSPMLRIKKIKVAKKAPAIFTDDELRALLKTCSGSTFEDRRDTALIRILMDNGVRVSGLAGLRYTPETQDTHDVLLSKHILRIVLKGGNEFLAPIGKKSAAALDRYIRARKRHRFADSPWLWLPVDARTTKSGEQRLTPNGIAQMIERRGEQAGIAHATPHKFRRTMASTWEGDVLTLMRVGGWESLEMARHYGKAREDERARDTHARLSPGDRI